MHSVMAKEKWHKMVIQGSIVEPLCKTKRTLLEKVKKDSDRNRVNIYEMKSAPLSVKISTSKDICFL